MHVIVEAYKFSCTYAEITDNKLVVIIRVYAHFHPTCRFAVNTAILNGVIHRCLDFRFVFHIEFKRFNVKSKFINTCFLTLI